MSQFAMILYDRVLFIMSPLMRFLLFLYYKYYNNITPYGVLVVSMLPEL